MKVALIDMDYTLVDITQPELFENLVMDILSKTFSRQVSKKQAHEIVRGDPAWLAEAGIRDKFWSKFDAGVPNLRLQAILSKTMRAMPGAHRLLSELEAREYYMALVTNAPKASAKVALDYLWLRNYFSAVSFSSDDVPIKPNPEMALRVLRGLRNIESIFLLGDSGYDIKCGQNISTKLKVPVTTIYLDNSKKGNVHGADFVVTTLDDVVELLQKGKI